MLREQLCLIRCNYNWQLSPKPGACGTVVSVMHKYLCVFRRVAELTHLCKVKWKWRKCEKRGSRKLGGAFMRATMSLRKMSSACKSCFERSMLCRYYTHPAIPQCLLPMISLWMCDGCVHWFERKEGKFVKWINMSLRAGETVTCSHSIPFLVSKKCEKPWDRILFCVLSFTVPGFCASDFWLKKKKI